MKKEKRIQVKTKRLRLIPKTILQLHQDLEEEKNSEMQKAYNDMITLCEENREDWLWETEWRVELKDGTSIGGICFKGAPNENAEVEIGYGIDENYQRRGYGFEAVSALIDWAFSDERVYFVMAQTDSDNNISQALLTKLGFTATNTLGEEGPLFELERPKFNYTAIYMCLGISVGLCFGISLSGNQAIGICLGVAIGFAVGTSLDKNDQKKREELQKKRKKS